MPEPLEITGTYDRVTKTATFRPSGHVCLVTPFARGAPRIRLFDGDPEDDDTVLLGVDRVDPWSEKDRRRAVKGMNLNGQAEIVDRELVVLARLLDKEAAASDDDDDTDTATEEIPYRATPAGLVHLRPTLNGTVPAQLTNFTATIVADVAEDDGDEVRRVFRIEAVLNERRHLLDVPADRFGPMNWPTEHLGANAVVYPGQGTKEHARAAIQLISFAAGAVPERRVYTHTGWRRTDEHGHIYLHGGGAIGADGAVPGVEVRLPDGLEGYVLPDPAAVDDPAAAARASLRTLDLLPDPVTFPVYAAIWRAAQGGADFSVHATGESGEGKTAYAALIQQHFGAGMDDRNIPGSWLSTANANERLAHATKDAILVIDDFVPTGTAHDRERLHREADRLLRAQGNRAGRQRMRADATLRASKPPRGLILSTGEDIPKGQSLRSRLLIVELAKGTMDWAALKACQWDGTAGLYAQALVGFVGFVARNGDERAAQLRADVERLRAQATASGAHRRTPAIVANLAAGFRRFLLYAQEVGAIDEAEAADYWRRCWAALGAAAAAQARHQGANEPTTQFLALLTAAVASGEAHVAGIDGTEPPNPAALGWRWTATGNGLSLREEWKERGKRIGWFDGKLLYLEPEASYAVAQDLARRSGDAITASAQTLRRRLHDRGLLAEVDEKRDTLLMRKTLGGGPKNVLVLFADALLPADAEEKPDKPDNGGPEGGATGASEGPNVGFGGFSPHADDTAAQSTFTPEQEERRQWEG